MVCCRNKRKKKLPKPPSAAARSASTVTAPLVDRRTTPTSTNPTPLLCRHLEDQGATLKVRVVESGAMYFEAGGSSFNLLDHLKLYACTGAVPTLVSVIDRNLKKLSPPPTYTSITLKQLLAVTIQRLKEA